MSPIAAIGERALVGAFAFAGVEVLAVDGPEAARAAWRALPEEVALVILTPAAHAAIEAGAPHGGRPNGGRPLGGGRRLVTVMAQ